MYFTKLELCFSCSSYLLRHVNRFYNLFKREIFIIRQLKAKTRPKFNF